MAIKTKMSAHLKRMYFNKRNSLYLLSRDATQNLPGTDKPINVTAGYKRLLAYYTSGNYTGDNAFEVGMKLADSYYKEVRRFNPFLQEVFQFFHGISLVKRTPYTSLFFSKVLASFQR